MTGPGTRFACGILWILVTILALTLASSASSYPFQIADAPTPRPLAYASGATVRTIAGGRTLLAHNSAGPAPLFFTRSALNGLVTVDGVDFYQLGDSYSAVVSYKGFDGSGLEGQLSLSRGPAKDPRSSFDSCVGHPITGPEHLGRFSVYYGECDVQMLYGFTWQRRLYFVGTKYYGGLNRGQLAKIVTGLTSVPLLRRQPRLPCVVDSENPPYSVFAFRVRPRQCTEYHHNIPGHATESYMNRIRWHHWGFPRVFGRSNWRYCGMGNCINRPAHLTAFRRRYACGRIVYTRLRMHLPAHRAYRTRLHAYTDVFHLPACGGGL